jgi:RNA polymerase sigma factor (sigma-70 family)
LTLTNEDVERLYREHADNVLRYLARRVLIPEVAVDLMAETFAQAYRDRRGFRGASDDEAAAWLFGIARHCLSAYRRRGSAELRALRRLGVERRALNDFEYERIEELADLRDALGPLDEGLDSIGEDQREAVRLRVLEELDYADVARALGVSEQTARARVSRALRALRELPAVRERGSERDLA